MFFCFVVAIFSTLYWIDSLVISVTNAKVNPYQKNIEEEKIIMNRTAIRLISIGLSAIFWGVIIIFW